MKLDRQTYFTPWRLTCIAIFLLAIAVYLPSLQAPAAWDDHHLLDPTVYGHRTTFIQALSKPFMDNYFAP